MKRIIVLGITLLMISSLAWVEKNQPLDPSPKAYKITISDYKFLVVTPLDEKRTVLVGIKKPFQKKADSYLAEGYVGLAISRIGKQLGTLEESPAVKKYVSEMVKARKLALEQEATEEW